MTDTELLAINRPTFHVWKADRLTYMRLRIRTLDMLLSVVGEEDNRTITGWINERQTLKRLINNTYGIVRRWKALHERKEQDDTARTNGTT